MNYSEYTDRDTTVQEYFITVSDGVSLKIIDFIPKNDNKANPVIQFIPGWISHISGWKEVLQKITSKYRTIYLETREKSSSILPVDKKVSFSMERVTEDIKDVIEKIIPKEREFVLSGSSLGATAILEYLALNKRNPESAILIGPNSEFRYPKIIGDLILTLHPSLYFVIKEFIKWYLRNFRINKKNEREQVEKYEYTLDFADPYKLKANAIAIKKYNIWGKLDQITTQILIIGASSDTLHNADNLKKMAGIMSNAEYTELPSNKETHSKAAGELIINYTKNKKTTETLKSQ